VYHRTDIGTIASAFLHGLAQRALDLIPLVDPWPEPGYPPTWWYNYDTGDNWRRHLNNRSIPDTWLIESYLHYTWRMLGFYAEEVGTWARDTAQSWARAVTGYALYNWNTFSNWIDSIGIRLGDGMVWWKATAVSALDALYNWLPPEIRTNLQSWGALLNYWIQKAKDWVVSTYHTYITWGTLAWAWCLGAGDTLNFWWQGAHALLDEFRANPTAFILVRLGSTWSNLVWFVNNMYQWYASLWSNYRIDLANFLADPAGWIYARLEAYLERIW
jgi:hypothetical protein